MAKKASKDLVENLLLFDPVTERGQDRLRSLGLLDKISPEIFFNSNNGFWSHQVDLGEFTRDDELNYDPTPNFQRIESIRERREDFERRFKNIIDREENEREFTLLMGVVGAGKSLEIQRQIYTNNAGKIPYYFERNQSLFAKGNSLDVLYKQMSTNVVCIDMERVNTEIPIGRRPYRCTDIDDPIALFYTKLLATLIYYIKFLRQYHQNELRQVCHNLTERFNNRSSGASSILRYEIFVEALKNYANGEDSQAINVFEAIKDTVKSEIAELDDPVSRKMEKPAITGIRALLHMLGFVMIGIAPDTKKCIVVDNIEDLIKVNNQDLINISLEAAKDIYKALLGYAENIRDIFNDAGLVDSFHIVMAFRRTTWNSLQARFAGNYAALVNDMFDITGDMSLEKLWAEKAYPIWKRYLEPEYDETAKAYIKQVNNWICTDKIAKNSFLRRYSRIMSSGLRRQGHSLSCVLFNIFFNTRYGIIVGRDSSYIKKAEYDDIFRELADEAFYLRKSAAVELYYKRQYTFTGIGNDPDVGDRWRQLDVGNLLANERNEIKKYYGLNGERRTDGAEYPFTKWAFRFYQNGKNPIPSGFILRQLLRTLAKAQESPRASRCVAPLYEAVSLRTVMMEVFRGTNVKEITDTQLRRLAEVMLAGGRPDTNGEYSPLFMLENGVDYTDIIGFQQTLQNIRDNDAVIGKDGEDPYSKQKCGIRITEAGADFLYNIQPSFEFFSALFCYDFPPLLFIKSYDRIAHVIGYVYKNAVRVCDSFEEAGDSTFRREVKDLHIKYLGHYRDYLDNRGTVLGFTPDVITLLKRQINNVIDEYNKWRA